jgi:hypothetical protein
MVTASVQLLVGMALILSLALAVAARPQPSRRQPGQ